MHHDRRQRPHPRRWNDGVILIDAAEGISMQALAVQLGIDMANLPTDLCFLLKIFNDDAVTPAIQQAEAAFPVERIFTSPFNSRDQYACDAIS